MTLLPGRRGLDSKGYRIDRSFLPRSPQLKVKIKLSRLLGTQTKLFHAARAHCFGPACLPEGSIHESQVALIEGKVPLISRAGVGFQSHHKLLPDRDTDPPISTMKGQSHRFVRQVPSKILAVECQSTRSQGHCFAPSIESRRHGRRAARDPGLEGNRDLESGMDLRKTNEINRRCLVPFPLEFERRSFQLLACEGQVLELGSS